MPCSSLREKWIRIGLRNTHEPTRSTPWDSGSEGVWRFSARTGIHSRINHPIIAGFGAGVTACTAGGAGGGGVGAGGGVPPHAHTNMADVTVTIQHA